MPKWILLILTLITTNLTMGQDNNIIPMKRHTANLYDGITYIDEGSGIPILFLHGTLSNADTWRKIIPTLSKNHRCIAIDLPIGGHSIALNKNIDLTPVGIANIIYEFLQILNLEKVIIISNDTGGAYAQIFASLHPDKVQKLVFTNCEVLEVFPPKKFKYLVNAVKIPGFTYLLGKSFQIESMLKSNMMMGLLSHKVTKKELSELYLKTFVKNKSIRRNFKDNAKTWSPKYTINAAVKLKKESFPVLILWGEDDKILFPIELGQQLKSIFINSKLVQIANAKTYIQEDEPDKMIKEIEYFLLD